MFVFPGIGLGAWATQAREIPESFMLAASLELAEQVRPDMLARGSLYPSLEDLRGVSIKIAAAVGRQAFQEGLAGIPEPADMEEFMRRMTWSPNRAEEVRALVDGSLLSSVY